MMNRTLQYFKNIKFNPLVNKTIAAEGKKKNVIIANKNRTKNHQYLLVRKYTTKTRPLSFNTGPFNQPEPPNDPFWIIIAAAGCGSYFAIKKK